jgi:hypothetical protein
MATLEYGTHLVISAPHYDRTIGAWVAYVRVITNILNHHDEKFGYCVVNSFTETFESEKQAEAFGFSKAFDWIEKNGTHVA